MSNSKSKSALAEATCWLNDRRIPYQLLAGQRLRIGRVNFWPASGKITVSGEGKRRRERGLAGLKRTLYVESLLADGALAAHLVADPGFAKHVFSAGSSAQKQLADGSFAERLLADKAFAARLLEYGSIADRLWGKVMILDRLHIQRLDAADTKTITHKF